MIRIMADKHATSIPTTSTESSRAPTSSVSHASPICSAVTWSMQQLPDFKQGAVAGALAQVHGNNDAAKRPAWPTVDLNYNKHRPI